MTNNELLQQLHRDLGFKLLNPVWAKLEILLGLAAFAIGNIVSIRSAIANPILDGSLVVFGVLLVIFGGYLAMAGHRSHIYQSNNKLAVWIFARVSAPQSTESLK